MRDPYASLLLNGIKTVETRNHAMLQGVTGLCLLHIGHQTMAEDEAAEFLWRAGLLDHEDIVRMTRPPPGVQRGQILGVVKLGETRMCSPDERASPDMHRKVASEVVGRYATTVLRAWWLRQPLRERGQPGVWQVPIPADMLPPELQPAGLVKATADMATVRGPSPDERPDLLPRLVIFDLDGVCWSPEMYQTRGGPPYTAIQEDVVVNSAGEEIRLHSAVRRVWAMLHSMRSSGRVRVAVASSSIRAKAQPLLSAFRVSPGVRMADVVDANLFEMYYRRSEYKRPHVQALLEKSGVPADEVLFLDDNMDNIRSTEDLGIVAVHIPRGLSEEAWAGALRTYREEHGL